MLSYPVMTGNVGIDAWLFTLLRQGALTQDLSEADTQHCITTFARRMLHALGQRKCSGEPMAGCEFVNWLELSVRYHQTHFLTDYHTVPTRATPEAGTRAFEISRSISSKQSEIGVGASEEVMLSDYDSVLASATCQLTPTSRIIILWHYFSGIPVREIASKIGLSESAVRSRIARASREMQMVLARRGYATHIPDDYSLHSHD